MSQSLVKNYVHLVFSTKRRQRWLAPDIRRELFAYQAGIYHHWQSPAKVIGGVEDHVHALFALSKNHALIRIVEEVKKGEYPLAEGTRTIELCMARRICRLLR